MAKKKTLLILLLIFSLASMIVLVFFIKNRLGIFGEYYRQYIERMVSAYYATIETNMNKIDSEIIYLSKDNLVQSVYKSSKSGENTEKYLEDFDKIKNTIPECQKIQVLDSEGKIIFSNDTNEIYASKIIKPIMSAIQNHFITNTNMYVYFLNKTSFASFYPISAEDSKPAKKGFVVLHYKMEKLLPGGPSTHLSVTYAMSNIILMSGAGMDTNKIKFMLSYINNPESYKKLNKGYKNLVIAKKYINGTVQGYYPNNEKYIPLFGIIALIINLCLFFMVVIALIQIMRNEKMIQDMPIKPVNVPLREKKIAEVKKDEIKDLIMDIEDNKPFEDKEAKKGIEDMILSNGIDLTASFPEAEPEINEMPEIDLSQEAMGETQEMIEISEPSFEMPQAINTYDHIKPSKETDLFAEEERILSNIESKAPVRKEKEINIDEDLSDEEIVLSESYHEEIPHEIQEEHKEDIVEFEPFSFEMEPFSGENPEEAAKKSVSAEKGELPEIKVEEMIPLTEEAKTGVSVPMDEGEAAMAEPPQKVSSICSVEDYGKVAFDLARNSLNILNILILKRINNQFMCIMKEGFQTDKFAISEKDPVFQMFLSQNKGLDIKGEIKNTRYLKERFSAQELDSIDEVFIVPIVKKESVVGMAIYGKQKGTAEATHFQKSELLNLGFLQDQ